MDAAQLQQILEAVLKKTAEGTNNSAALATSIDARLSPFNYDPETGHTYEAWLKRYGQIIVQDGQQLSDNSRVQLLVGKLSETEYKRYIDSIAPKNQDNFSWDETTTKLKQLFGENRSLFLRRFDCFQIRQGEYEDIPSLVALINSSCENAELQLSKEELKCMLLVIALRDEFTDLRQRCLQRMEDARTNKKPITLQDLGEECRKYQLLKESALSLNSKPCSTNAIRSKPQQIKEKFTSKGKPQHRLESQHQPKYPQKQGPKNDHPDRACYSCGGKNHWQKDCWYKNSTCETCGRQGHTKKVCKSGTQNRRVRAVATNPDMQTHVHTISVTPQCMAVKANNKWWQISVEINGIGHKMNVDTGAQITVITDSSWAKLGKPQLCNSTITVKNCNEKAFSIEGEFKCQVSYLGHNFKELIAYVSNEINYDLLGMPWIEALEVIPKEVMFPNQLSSIKAMPTKELSSTIKDEKSLVSALKTEYTDVFGPELGHCTKFRAHLSLKKDAKSVFCKARPVPHGALEAVNAEIDRLLNMGAIEPMEFSHWAAPILAVKKKNGKTRVCIDFSTGLNDALELHRHPLPRPEDIYNAIAGAKIFSRLDLRDAYLQLELSEASKALCVLNTHRGLFKCTRLPFGVKSAPAIFQSLMDKLIASIPGAFVYLDDVIIANKDLDDHIKTIFAVFDKIKDYGLRISLEKCSFLQRETLFLGHIISEKGIVPDPKREEAIRKMPAPHDKSTLRSFLGALTYYGKFIKEMRELRSPLDELLKKDTKWEWGEAQQRSFEKAKEIMLSDLLLTHYDPKLPIVVAADASKDGIGATISHIFPDKSERVIEHASCTFSAAQQNYSQIEKEALGLIFAVQKFHRMLYGRKFTLLTDHKPLLAIFGSKKGIPIYSASRLQRWALILSNYEFDIRYVSTNAFGNVDVLSRLIANYPRPEEDILIANICDKTECFVNFVFQAQTDQLPITAKEIADHTTTDEVMKQISNFTKHGWPQKLEDNQLMPFYPKRDQITEIEGCLIYGDRVFIPSTLRIKMLKSLHFAHPGIVRMKAIAKNHVYWPGINNDIERTVRQCEECQLAAKNPTKTHIQPWKAATAVFERVHIDFAGPCEDGQTYLILVDAYSKWPEVWRMEKTTSQITITVLKSIINRLGIPKEIVSDNGTQFRSAEFAQFCKEFGIQHTFTPPYHPMSNGAVERFVDVFKRAMKKGRNEGKDWAEKALLAYRTTPSAVLDSHSPDELFLGRRLRTKLSLVHPERQKEKPVDLKNLDKFRKQNQKKMERQFNQKHGTKSSNFQNGEAVFIWNLKGNKAIWLPGTVIERVQNSPTYRVEVPALRRAVHRHANQMRRRFPLEMEDQNEQSVQDFPVDNPEIYPRTETPVAESPIRQAPTRQSTRLKKAPKRLDMDPSQPRYNYARH